MKPVFFFTFGERKREKVRRNTSQVRMSEEAMLG